MYSAAQQDLIPCLLPHHSARFGRYTLLYRFGSGGMANVYAAKLGGSDGFEKVVAIKVMHQHLTGDAEFVKMFIDEARLACRITHPNVVQILELGRVNSSHFIAMEHVNGESVLAVLRRTRLPHSTTVQIVAAAALGLHAAHDLRDDDGRLLDVVHRDVSPDNILVGYDGSVRVADFGVARTRDALHTTLSGTVKGKFSYMAPEQALGHRVDRRADVFSLGIVLFEMNTGQRLFRSGGEAEAIQAVIRCNVPQPSRLVHGFPVTLERIVLRALQRNPDGRFQTALELHDALMHYLAESRQTANPTAIAETMQTLFAHRIEEKRRLLRQFTDGKPHCVPDMGFQTDGSSIEMLVVSALQRPSRWPGRIGVALAVVLALAVVVLLLVPGPRGVGPDRIGATPRADAGVQRVARRPAAVATGAPEIPATRGTARRVRLQRRPAAHAPRSKPRPRRRKRRRRPRGPRLTDREALANPYVR